MNYDKVTRVDGTECYIVPVTDAQLAENYYMQRDLLIAREASVSKLKAKIDELQLDLKEATDALHRINVISEGWRPGGPSEDEMDQLDRLDRLDKLAQSEKRP